MTESRAWWSAALTSLFLLAVVCLGFPKPPAARPATAPQSEFSADRAMIHVRALSRAPHPLGSAEHDQVRDYIVGALKSLHLDVEVQKTTAVTAKYRAVGSVENIVARLVGTGTTRGAFMLVAHYDSVAAGPGAGDDASGVAAILEAMRAVTVGPPLANDLIVLITDGEEEGLLGASAFVAEHRYAKQVRLAINFEARGNSGVASLFETSPGNGVLIAESARNVDHLAGTSLAYEVYKRLPNDTDVTVFKGAGMAALNFAFVGHWAAYHTRGDDADHLDRGSLEQQGEYALSLARAFGQRPLDALSGGDAIFFSLPLMGFVHYTVTGGLVMVVGVVVVFAWTLWAAFSMRRARIGGVAAGALFFVTLVVSAGGLGYAFARIVTELHESVLPPGDVVRSALYGGTLAVLALVMWGGAFSLIRKKLSVLEVTLGAAFSLGALAVVTSCELPGASYLFAWPALGASIASALRVRRPDRETMGVMLEEWVLALPAVAIFVPLLVGIFEGLGLTPMGGPAIAILVVLLAGSIVPSLERLRVVREWLLPSGALVVAVLFFVMAAVRTRVDVEHPATEQLWYLLDADTGYARWASSAHRVDDWTRAFVGANPAHEPIVPGWSRRWAQADADPLPFVPPEVIVRESMVVGGERMLHLAVQPARAGALNVAVSGSVVEIRVNGHTVPSADSFTYMNAPAAPDGIDLVLRVEGTGSVAMTVTERWPGLPVVPGKPLRPSWSATEHDGDQTVVKRTFHL